MIFHLHRRADVSRDSGVEGVVKARGTPIPSALSDDSGEGVQRKPDCNDHMDIEAVGDSIL
jgi:hypothetical protein